MRQCRAGANEGFYGGCLGARSERLNRARDGRAAGPRARAGARRAVRHGASAALEDPTLFADIDTLLRAAIERSQPAALLLPELLGDPSTWRLETAIKYQSHRGTAGAPIIFVKQRLLMPMFRWLSEFNRDNFERQRRINQVLFACVQELATEPRSFAATAGTPPRAVRPAAPVKLAFVVQRYGADIAGGSETHCRQLAERLCSRHDITVLTTCARDYVTWENAYPPGDPRRSGVRVQRFPVARTRNLKTFADLSDEVFDDLGSTPEREMEWFHANGPDAPALLEHLRTHGRDYDLVLFWAFRYAPTFFGLPSVAERGILLPTAEEDPAVDLDVLPEFFARPAGYLFLTPEEEALVSTRAGRALRPSQVIGIGLEPDNGVPPSRAAARPTCRSPGIRPVSRTCRPQQGMRDAPRVLPGIHRRRWRHDAVLAGPSTLMIPRHARIRALGYVPDDVRRALLTRARALVVPSPYESLSIVLLEAWNHGIPALVNALLQSAAGSGAPRQRRSVLPLLPRISGGVVVVACTRRRQARARRAGTRICRTRVYRWPTVTRTGGDAAGRSQSTTSSCTGVSLLPSNV